MAVEQLASSSRGAGPELARAFHVGVVGALVEVAQRVGAPTVALSGGCFQNALLLHLARSELSAAGFRVLTARELPPNDGAIAAGQALAALLSLARVELPSPSPHVSRGSRPGA